MKGISITLRTPHGIELDRFGNEQYLYDEQTIADVLVEPGATEFLEASRPEGAKVAYTLHFPKTFDGSLEGCEIELPEPWAGAYRVVGEPGRYMRENTPTRWYFPVEVERAYG